MQKTPLSLLQNLIKVPFNLMQIALVLNYLFTAQSAAGDETKIQHMLELGNSEWQAAFLPGSVDHASDWWIEIRKKLLEAGDLRAFSVGDLKAHLGNILSMLQGISLEQTPPMFVPWIQRKPCTRPFGSRVSLALFCSSFSITTVSNHQLVDPWMFNRGFVVEMHRCLGKSPLFDSGIRLEHLNILLRNVEAVLDLEDERSAAIQPYSLDLRNLFEMEAYYASAFRAIEPGILLNLWQKWKTVWNQYHCPDQYQWSKNKSLLILGQANHGELQHA
jgi:hypothetical protein